MRRIQRRAICLLNGNCQKRFVSHSKTFNVEGTLLTDGPIVGSHASVVHTFSQEEVDFFANLSGDTNPLHNDPSYAKNTMFGGTIVHGILVSSLFSTLFGRSLTGSIYVSQSLNFKSPVHVGAEVIAKMEIKSAEKKRKGMLLTCSTTVRITSTQTLAIDGEARVMLPFPPNL